jgi:hypothetical protein
MILIPLAVLVAMIIITISILQGYKISNPIYAIAGIARLLVVELPLIIFSFLSLGLMCLACLGGLFLAGIVVSAILSAIFPFINTSEGFGHIQNIWFYTIQVFTSIWIIATFTLGGAGFMLGLALIAGLLFFLGLHSSIIATGFSLINILIVVVIFCSIVIGFHSLKNL